MGTDIHMYVEVRQKGEWKLYGGKNDFYDGRNYALFAILANVRNGYGFAGCDTGNGFVPISTPRGLPDNVDNEILEYSWGHSHSWLLLSEILAHNWEQRTKLRGFVQSPGYQEFKENGHPTYYCGGFGGVKTRLVSNKEMDEILKNPNNDDTMLQEDHQ